MVDLELVLLQQEVDRLVANEAAHGLPVVQSTLKLLL